MENKEERTSAEKKKKKQNLLTPPVCVVQKCPEIAITFNVATPVPKQDSRWWIHGHTVRFFLHCPRAWTPQQRSVVERFWNEYLQGVMDVEQECVRSRFQVTEQIYKILDESAHTGIGCLADPTAEAQLLTLIFDATYAQLLRWRHLRLPPDNPAPLAGAKQDVVHQ